MTVAVAGGRLADLAAAQFGVVDLDQCRAAGLTERYVGWQVRSGRWQRVHPRVYAVTTGPLPPATRWSPPCCTPDRPPY